MMVQIERINELKDRNLFMHISYFALKFMKFVCVSVFRWKVLHETIIKITRINKRVKSPFTASIKYKRVHTNVDCIGLHNFMLKTMASYGNRDTISNELKRVNSASSIKLICCNVIMRMQNLQNFRVYFVLYVVYTLTLIANFELYKRKHSIILKEVAVKSGYLKCVRTQFSLKTT